MCSLLHFYHCKSPGACNSTHLLELQGSSRGKWRGREQEKKCCQLFISTAAQLGMRKVSGFHPVHALLTIEFGKDLSPLPVRAWRVVALFLWKGKAKSVEGQHGGFSLKLRSKQKLFLCSNRLLPTLFIFGPAELCQSSWGRLQAADKERSLGDIELNLVALFLHSPWFFVSPRGDTCSQQKGRRKKRGSWWRKWCLRLRCVQGGHCNPDLGGSVRASLESVQLLCGQVSSQNAADLKIELRRGEELKEK